MKPETVKLSINGKVIERGKLTRSAPQIVWYTEHSAITKAFRKGKSKKQAAADYKARAARMMLEAALQILNQMDDQTLAPEDRITKAYFLQTGSAPVVDQDGDPVQLEEYEE